MTANDLIQDIQFLRQAVLAEKELLKNILPAKLCGDLSSLISAKDPDDDPPWPGEWSDINSGDGPDTKVLVN